MKCNQDDSFFFNNCVFACVSLMWGLFAKATDHVPLIASNCAARRPFPLFFSSFHQTNYGPLFLFTKEHQCCRNQNQQQGLLPSGQMREAGNHTARGAERRPSFGDLNFPILCWPKAMVGAQEWMAKKHGKQLKVATNASRAASVRLLRDSVQVLATCERRRGVCGWVEYVPASFH